MNSTVDRSKIGKSANKHFTKHSSFSSSQNDSSAIFNRKTKEELAPIRRSLPIFEYRDALIQAIQTHNNIIVVGETGSGKTTQVPQYLYEAGLVSQDPKEIGCIAITQPRRVAAMTLAERVSQEVGTPLGDAVGYTIRFDDKSSQQTKLKFLTDGMLLREIQIDPKLSRYKVIVLDEAHERTLNTDILFGLLKTLQKEQRPDLKLVVMSATLDADKFSKYLSDAPVALIPGRTHPVDVFYVDEETTVEKHGEGVVNFYDKNDMVALVVMQLHQNKPLDGDILVFMPGSDDIESAKEVLLERSQLLQEVWRTENEAKLIQKQIIAYTQYRQKKRKEAKRNKKLKLMNDDSDNENFDHAEVIDATTFTHHFDKLSPETREEIMLNINTDDISALPPAELHVVSLYSSLDPNLQLFAFAPPPEGKRKVILSTNIAETSVTVSGVKYVIDTGLSKVKSYQFGAGATGSLQSEPISRAEAAQRTGRAGREQPGECYRLYTEDEYEEAFKPTPIPEIARSSFTASFLQLLSLNITNPRQFPLIDSPPDIAFHDAATELLRFNALDKDGLTELGRLMATFPIEPIYSRLLILSARPELLYLPKMPLLEDMNSLGSTEKNKKDKNNKNDKKNDKKNQNKPIHTNNSTVDYLTSKREQLAQLQHSKETLKRFTLEAIQEQLNRDDIDPSILASPCSEEMCIMIAALSVDNLTISIPQNSASHVLKAKVEGLQQEHYSNFGDVFFSFNILVQFIKSGTVEKRKQFCQRYYYNFRNLAQAMNIYQQLCCLVLQSDLPLISCLKDTHPKKTLTYAQFYHQRGNSETNLSIVNEVVKQTQDGFKMGQIYEPPTWLRTYLDENRDQMHSLQLLQLDREDQFSEQYNHGNKDQQDQDDGVEWEENLAKCLTAAFFQNLALMQEDGKFLTSSSKKEKVQLHPTSTLNTFLRKEKRDYKELKEKVTTRVQSNQNLPRELRAPSGGNNANDVNTGKGVPQTFKQFSQYNYVLYSELLKTKQAYLRGCFRTKEEWLEIYSRGYHKFDRIHKIIEKHASTAAAGSQAHDQTNSQQNNSWFGKKGAFSNLTGKSLAHSVSLGAGQKELGLQKTVIGSDGKVQQKIDISHLTGSKPATPSKPSTVHSKQSTPKNPDIQKRQGKLAIGVREGHVNKKTNTNSPGPNGQQFVALNATHNAHISFSKGKK